MTRLLKFLRLVLGDFVCDVILPMIVVALFFLVFWFIASAVGTAVVYWFNVPSVKTPDGEEADYVVGFLVFFGFIGVGGIITGLINLFFWLRRKWNEAGQLN